MKLTLTPEQFAETKQTLRQRAGERGLRLFWLLVLIIWVGTAVPAITRLPGPTYAAPANTSFFLSLFLFFPLSMFSSIVWHELGHLVAGRLIGYRFVLVTLGPLRIAREAGGLHLRLISTNLMAWQGRALSIPTGDDYKVAHRVALLIGGPLATLIQLLLALLLYTSLAGETVSYWLAQGILWLSFGAVFLLPSTALPLRILNVPTDAYQIIRLLRGQQRTAAQTAVYMLTVQSLRGERPRDLNPQWLAQARTAESPQEAASAYFLAYFHALDQGRIEDAAGFLNQALAYTQGQPLAQRSPLFAAEAAYFEARFSADLEVAQRWLTLLQPDQYNPLALEVAQVVLRSQAQVKLREGDLAAAKTAALHSQQLLQRTVDLGGALYEQEILDEILAQTQSVATLPQLPPELQPLLGRKRPYLVASGRALLLLALFILIGVGVGLGLRQLNPNSDYNQARQAVERGRDYLAAADYETAVVEFSEAIRLYPRYGEAYANRAEAYVALGQFEAAIADYDRLIALYPDIDPVIYAHRGSAYVQLGAYEQAIADYEYLLSQDLSPDLRRWAELALADVQSLQGR